MPDIKYLKRLMKETQTGSAGRRFYPKRFKRLIIEALKSGQESPTSLSGQLGIHPNVMTKWMQLEKARPDGALKPVKIINEQKTVRPVAQRIVLEKENGIKIHLSGISNNALIELVRHI